MAYYGLSSGNKKNEEERAIQLRNLPHNYGAEYYI